MTPGLWWVLVCMFVCLGLLSLVTCTAIIKLWSARRRLFRLRVDFIEACDCLIDLAGITEAYRKWIVNATACIHNMEPSAGVLDDLHSEPALEDACTCDDHQSDDGPTTSYELEWLP
jgi:hypothetical protein